MPIFKPLEVLRTQCAADNPVLFDDGRAASEYYSPSDKYFGKQTCPHDNKWSDGSPSFMSPIAHYHLLQQETFHVASDSGHWSMRGQKIKLEAGDDITIPRCVAHTFKSIPNSKQEPLVVLYRYNTQRFKIEERFRRNGLMYLYNCKSRGVPPSICQRCIFLADCWMPGEFFGSKAIPVPGLLGEYIGCAVNTIFMWVMAAIGMLLYGY